MQLGHVTSEHAYAPALAKMKARVMVLKTLPLDQLEKAQLYKIWVQPVINLTARGYEPDARVLSSMNVVFKTALGVTSRSLAPNLVAEVRSGGGLQPQPLPVYARFVFTQLWVSFVENRKQYQGPWMAEGGYYIPSLFATPPHPRAPLRLFFGLCGNEGFIQFLWPQCLLSSGASSKVPDAPWAPKALEGKFCPLCNRTLSLNQTLTRTPTATLNLVLTQHLPLPLAL